MPELSEKELLGEDITADYVPTSYFSLYPQLRHTPAWSVDIADLMLRDDRILFGLSLIIGPIVSNIEVEYQGTDSQQMAYAQKSVERYIQTALGDSLSMCLAYGWSGGEVRFEEEDGLIYYDRVKTLQSRDVTPVTSRSELVGMVVRGNSTKYGGGPVFVGGAKCLWTVHQRIRHPWFGRAHTHGALRAFWEKWANGGFLDQRKLWYYKNAFDSGEMYHPEGSVRGADGQLISAKILARELIDKKRSGATLVFPHVTDEKGIRKWEYVRPTATDVPSGLHDYGYDLNDEEFWGMLIPPELVESSSDGGLGSATGRSIPVMAFENCLTAIGNDRIQDLMTQVITPVGTLMFPGKPFKVIATVKKIKLTESALPGMDGLTDETTDEDDENKNPEDKGKGFPPKGDTKDKNKKPVPAVKKPPAQS